MGIVHPLDKCGPNPQILFCDVLELPARQYYDLIPLPGLKAGGGGYITTETVTWIYAMDFFGLRARCWINIERQQYNAEDFNLKPLTVPEPCFC